MVIVCEDLKMSVLNFNTLLSGFNYMDLKELAIKYNVTATDDADKKASRCEAGGGGYAHEWAASQYVPDVAVK